tara:strand:- start:28 stop:375 length:348 start_codon:yes stop_codon:yes gene_type:complete
MKVSEAKIQQQIVVWFRNNYCLNHHNTQCLIFSVPNERGGYLSMKNLILTGLLSGVSDLIVVMKGKVLFVEVKNATGKQSVKQKVFQSTVTKLGFQYYLVRDLETFQSIIKLIML